LCHSLGLCLDLVSLHSILAQDFRVNYVRRCVRCGYDLCEI